MARFNRCAYYNIFRATGLAQGTSTLGAADETRAHEQFLDDIADQLHVVLAQLKPDSLRTFQSVSSRVILIVIKTDNQ